MLADLTPDQLADWIGYYNRNPWTPDRDDLRQEVMICRLLGIWANAPPESLPTPFHPYFEEQADPAEVLREIRNTEERLEQFTKPDGTTAWRWKV